MIFPFLFPWFFNHRCNCESNNRKLSYKIENIETELRYARKKEVHSYPLLKNTLSHSPEVKKKWDFDFDKYWNEAEVYECMGGVNSNKITELTSFDLIESIKMVMNRINTIPDPNSSDKFKSVNINHDILLFSDTDLSKDLAYLNGFVLSIECLSGPVYESEWGIFSGNVRAILYDDHHLKHNEDSFSRANTAHKVYSSFLVARDDNGNQEVIHIKSTRISL